MLTDTLLLLAEGTSEFTLEGMWAQMGVFARAVLILLILQFVITMALAVERALVFSKARSTNVTFIMKLRNLLAERKLQEAASAATATSGSPIAKLVGAGMGEYVRGLEAIKEEGPDDVGDFDLVDAVNRQMERAKERETANLKRGLALIATTGSTAPFVGLLGTVVGIINSFQGISSDGGGGLSSVAGGISEALLATAVGLLVAIPAVMLNNFFNARVQNMQIDMNDVASELIDFVLREGRY